jgi:hypothetical protein
MSNLPMNIVVKILTYMEGFIIRDGKMMWISRIPNTDIRYEMLYLLFIDREEDLRNEFCFDNDTAVLILHLSRKKDYILRIYTQIFYNSEDTDDSYYYYYNTVREFTYYRSMCSEEVLCIY